MAAQKFDLTLGKDTNDDPKTQTLYNTEAVEKRLATVVGASAAAIRSAVLIANKSNTNLGVWATCVGDTTATHYVYLHMKDLNPPGAEQYVALVATYSSTAGFTSYVYTGSGSYDLTKVYEELIITTQAVIDATHPFDNAKVLRIEYPRQAVLNYAAQPDTSKDVLTSEVIKTALDTKLDIDKVVGSDPYEEFVVHHIVPEDITDGVKLTQHYVNATSGAQTSQAVTITSSDLDIDATDPLDITIEATSLKDEADDKYVHKESTTTQELKTSLSLQPGTDAAGHPFQILANDGTADVALLGYHDYHGWNAVEVGDEEHPITLNGAIVTSGVYGPTASQKPLDGRPLFNYKDAVGTPKDSDAIPLMNLDIEPIKTDITNLQNEIDAINNRSHFLFNVATYANIPTTYADLISEMPTDVLPTINDYIVVQVDSTHSNNTAVYTLQEFDVTADTCRFAFDHSITTDMSGKMNLVTSPATAGTGNFATFGSGGQVVDSNLNATSTLASKMNIVGSATAGNIATFTATGQVVDSGSSITAIQNSASNLYVPKASPNGLNLVENNNSRVRLTADDTSPNKDVVTLEPGVFRTDLTNSDSGNSNTFSLTTTTLSARMTISSTNRYMQITATGNDFQLIPGANGYPTTRTSLISSSIMTYGDCNSNYLALTGGTLTGNLVISSGSKISVDEICNASGSSYLSLITNGSIIANAVQLNKALDANGYAILGVDELYVNNAGKVLIQASGSTLNFTAMTFTLSNNTPQVTIPGTLYVNYDLSLSGSNILDASVIQCSEITNDDGSATIFEMTADGAKLGNGLYAEGNVITGLPDPTDASDAVPKSYVDSFVQTMWYTPNQIGGGSEAVGTVVDGGSPSSFTKGAGSATQTAPKAGDLVFAVGANCIGVVDSSSTASFIKVRVLMKR